MNDTIVEARNLIKHYKDLNALDNVNLSLSANRIYGLLGRNGAGKTTLMSILTAQAFATSGEALVFGGSAYENDAVLSRICFIRESQKYPDDFQPQHAFRSAALFYKNWDQGFADRLAEDFQLPVKRRIKKLSRGQLSAVGVIIGLASRAELTFFDEPYLGLDAVARQLFYDRLVEDYAEHPRTIILSSHLIDEVANLLEHVIVIDRGTDHHGRRCRRDPGFGCHCVRFRRQGGRLPGRPQDPAPRNAGVLGLRDGGRGSQRPPNAPKPRSWALNYRRFPCNSWWCGRPWPVPNPASHQIPETSPMTRWRQSDEQDAGSCPDAAD